MLSGIIGGSLGLIGVIISLFFSFKLNKNNQSFQKDLMKKDQEYKLWEKKYNALIQMISYRYDVKSPEYTSAMNGAIAVFHDSKPVMNSIKKFYEYLSNDNRDPAIANEKMVEIYIAMYEDLGIEENVDEIFLNKVFNGNPE